jgi:hypothetical protein
VPDLAERGVTAMLWAGMSKRTEEAQGASRLPETVAPLTPLSLQPSRSTCPKPFPGGQAILCLPVSSSLGA